MRNRFFRESVQALCATVESVVLWFDLAQRKPVLPPEQLATAWGTVDHADDYEVWPARAKSG